MTPVERKALFLNILRAVVWAALVVFLWRFVERLPAAAEWRTLFAGGAGPFVALFAVLFVGASALRTARWIGLVRASVDVGFAEGFAVFCWSFLVMTVTPLRAGELLRPAWVRRRGGSFLTATGMLVVERLADLTVLLGAVAVVALTGQGTYSGAQDWRAALPAPVLLVVLAGAYFAVTWAAPRLSRWARGRAEPSGLMAKLAETLDGMAHAADPGRSARVLLLTLAVWAMLAGGYHLVLSAMFPGLHWSAALAVVALVNLAGVLWISPGNIGPFEAIAVLVLGAYGIAPPEALAAALVLHATVLGVTAVQGLVGRALMARFGTPWRDLV